MEKSYHCHICDKSFGEKRTLKQHISKVHSDHQSYNEYMWNCNDLAKIHTENTFNLKSIRIFIQTNIVIQFCLQTKPALSSAEVFTQYLYVISLDILYIFGCFIKSCVTSFKVMAVVWRFGYLYPFYIQCFHWQKFPPNCFLPLICEKNPSTTYQLSLPS